VAETPPFEREPRNEHEWRLLFEWRLRQVEKRLDNLTRAVVSVLVVVIAGVLIYFITPPRIQQGALSFISTLLNSLGG
jgi:hypothetical protein